MSVYASRRRRQRTILTRARNQVMERSKGLCEAHERLLATGFVCDWQGDQAHHILTRARGGMDTADNLLWVCARAHERIHAHPKLSDELGLLRHSWDDQ